MDKFYSLGVYKPIKTTSCMNIFYLVHDFALYLLLVSKSKNRFGQKHFFRILNKMQQLGSEIFKKNSRQDRKIDCHAMKRIVLRYKIGRYFLSVEKN